MGAALFQPKVPAHLGCERTAMQSKARSASPEMFACGDRPAVVVTRGEIAESEHFACCAACDPDGRVVMRRGNIDHPLFMRSSAKPLISTVVVASGAYERFGLNDIELAVATGSHGGEPFHIAAVAGMLQKIGLDESALKCGVHPPLNAASAAALAQAGKQPTAIYNNCSGKHAAILALALHRGAGLVDYLSARHPAQAEILDGCAELLGVPRAKLVTGTDGCGIPAIAVPLRAAATFYAKMSNPNLFDERWRAAVERVRNAMTTHPEYIAGTDRFDTTLMRAGAGDIACKGGAEGYHATAALPWQLGLCVKIADGNPRAIPPFVINRLQLLGIATAQTATLDNYRVTPITNRAGTLVGEIFALP
jgi:L-asparaginase II